MANGYKERAPQASRVPDASKTTGLELAAYAEEDDGETRMFELRPSEPRWLVQVTPFDRRAMDTTRLIAEVQLGLVQRGTLVWRGGMHDWLPIERIGEFLLGPAQRVLVPPGRAARGVVLVSSALIVLAAAATTLWLAASGVFG